MTKVRVRARTSKAKLKSKLRRLVNIRETSVVHPTKTKHYDDASVKNICCI